MKKIIILLVIILAGFVFTFAALPATDARFLEKEITYTLNPDGSWVKEYRHIVKLETYYSFNRVFGETFIVYDPKLQELKVLKSETTMKDGKKVQSPENAFNEVLPYEAHSFPRWAHMREMVVTHTGLERGATIELHYRITTKPGLMPYFSALEHIAEEFPVERSVFKISVPSGKALKYSATLPGVKPEIKKGAKGDEYIFRFDNVDSYLFEPYCGRRDRSFLVFSDANDWDSVMLKTAGFGPLPEALVKKAKKIKKDTPHTDACLFKIQDEIIGSIDSCYVPLAWSGYQTRSFEKIYTSNYGTVIEKGYLFYKLLQHLGFDVDLVFVPEHRALAKDVPALSQFDDFYIRAIGGDGKPVYLKTWRKDERSIPYRYAGLPYYSLNGKTFKKIEAGQDKPGVSVSGTLEIDKNIAKGDLDVVLSGRFYRYSAAMKDSKAALKKALAEILPVSKLEVKQVLRLTSRQLAAVVSVEGTFLKKFDDNRFYMDKLRFPYLNNEMVAFKTRKTSLYLDAPIDFNIRLDLKACKKRKVIITAPEVSVKNALGAYFQKVELLEDGGVRVEMSLNTQKAAFAPGEYPQIREVLKKCFVKQPLFILKNK